MNSVKSSLQSLREMFVGKTQEFIDEIDSVHLVWLEEIQQEANRMFSRYLELKGNLVVFLNHLLLSSGLTASKFYSQMYFPFSSAILLLSQN